MIWDQWNLPNYIKQWYFASDDWCVLNAENDLKVGGRFKTTMGAKDGSAEFDFSGVYQEVELYDKIAYVLDDGRKAITTFQSIDGLTKVTTQFDPENDTTREIQRNGWFAILDNFKNLAEKNTANTYLI